MEPIEITGISLGSIFKILIIGMVMSVVPLFTALGLLATFGMPTLVFAGEPVTGIQALFLGPIQGLTICLFFSIIASPLAAIGLWIMKKYTSLSLTIRIDEIRD